ncbi:SusC/RagA family TonB-linked outer membrane protein [Prevotella sp. A2931]|uniref:SusC/RagA family TonB-linked outer membrane protein n=2 Tax=Prevotellaceae TaxID=171552 RepID=A0ABS3M809_9BACT|nr:SusC/RagA family TonB-linked outer membrane protein [Prevotella illustrans]PTL27304.1 SusC/RagA family TonB-linked outer membrane protein [Prevotella sp. oral taxon 820]
MSLCMLSTFLLQAQNKHSDADVLVDITVVDESGEPLPGASIKVSGKPVGVVSNVDGKASLWVPRNANITVSYLGMKPRIVKVSKPISGKFVLQNDDHTLEQVVVTGYTQTDVRKSTGSVSMITGKDLNDSPLKNVDMLLQGKLTGVSVQAVSGKPGQSAKIRVRGVSSITGSSEPLWVVDGVPIQKDIPSAGSSYIRSGDFSTLYANGVAGINPQDIESITVLKDASASAIYGSQAQAGVIVITTKRGKQGKLSISYSGSLSLQSAPIRDDNLMNSREKLDYEQSIWDEFSAKGYAAGTYYPVIGIVGQIRSGYGRFKGWSKEQQDAYINELGQSTTDWFKELFRTTVSTSHNISLSGGTDKQTYYISGGVTTNNGIVKRTNADSYNMSAKFNGTPLEKLSYGLSIDFSYLKSLSPSEAFNIYKYAYFANPYESLYNADGSYRADETYFSVGATNGDHYTRFPKNGINIMREINETTLKSTSSTTTLRGDLTWRPFTGFRLYGLASATFSNDNSESEIGAGTYNAWTDRPFEGVDNNSYRTYGSFTQSASHNVSWLARLQANYGITLATKHRLSAIAGTEVRYNKASAVGSKMYGYDPLTGSHVTPLYIGAAENGNLTAAEAKKYRDIVNGLNTYSMVKNSFASFYGALDYVYDNKYVWNATVRSDGSNNFGSKEQFNLTWSTGLAWNIDEEKFFEAVKPVMNRATIRVSTGLTGGVNKSVYPQIIMSYRAGYRTVGDKDYRLGNIQSAPNPHLRWEHTRDYNVSLDMGFLNDRISMYVSAYRRRGYDLVTPITVVSTTGFTSQSYNTTEQINQGFEVTLNATPIRKKNFTWGVSGNISYNQNYISKYDVPHNAFSSVVLNYPQASVFTGISTGIDPFTGYYTFKLRPDATLSTSQDWRNQINYLFYRGTANAPWTGGFSTHASYKNFSLSINSSFSIGAKTSTKIDAPVAASRIEGSKVNNPQTDRSDLYTAYLNKPRAAAYRWTEANPVTDGYPRLVDRFGQRLDFDLDQTTASEITDAIYYENSSYFKIGSVSLSYMVPDKLARKLGLSSFGASVTGSNLLMITNYSGLNPETPGAVYPISRSFSFTVNLGL